MKKIFRMIIFSALAIYLTSLWNKGFVVPLNLSDFFQGVIVIAIIYYFINPLTKIVLLPLNILTLGMVSFIAFFIIFYFFVSSFSFIEIKEWVFPGINWYGFNLEKMDINYLGNLILSSLSISLIINSFEKLL